MSILGSYETDIANQEEPGDGDKARLAATYVIRSKVLLEGGGREKDMAQQSESILTQFEAPKNWGGTPESLIDYHLYQRDLNKLASRRELNRLNLVDDCVLLSKFGRS
jgi:hypothetical protein